MENLKKIKGLLTNTNDNDATNLINVIIRLTLSGLIILGLIIVWSYYVFRVSVPFVPSDTTSIQAGERVTVDGEEVDDSLWHPFNLFCAAQVNNPTQTTASPTEPTTTELTCPTDKVVYKCDGTSESYPIGTDGSYRSIDNPYIIENNLCLSSQEIDINKSWCDLPGLRNTTDSTTGTVSTILTDRIKSQCCKDREYQSNINYIGLILYLLITVPIIYFFIDKLFSKFIYAKDTEERNKITTKKYKDDEDRASKTTGAEFSNLLDMVVGGVGVKAIIGLIIGYYVLLPLFRYFFVSYRCENVIGKSNDPNCGKQCNSDSECINANNSSCSSCNNNICSLSFSDYDENINPSGISISVCGINSILNYLKPEEIDDIYNKFLQPVNQQELDNDAKKQAIITHLSANQDDKKLFTSYYYRFYPRQEIFINDTLTPFSFRLPKPPNIIGYDYLLNNFIQLEEYSAPNEQNCNNNDNELNCNNNHNCKWNLSTSNCEDNNDCLNDRYQLPIIDAISAHQTLNDNLDLHNKVIRSGIDYDTSTNTYPENLYPCNDVVFSNSFKIMAKNDISATGTPISDMDNWINHFELKRDECSDKMGQCYLYDYVCENSKGYPIPLKNLQLGSSTDFTIGAISNKGCQTALYPCDQSQLDRDCLAIIENDDGYILEIPEGGICKQLTWTDTANGGTWEESSNSDLQLSYKCVPKDANNQPSSLSAIRFTNASVPKWITNKTDVTTKCKSVNKIPRSNIDEINTPTTNINNYYRWNSVSYGDNLLCSEWNAEPNTCSSSKVINNLATYRTNQDPLEQCCIDVMDQSGPISLYARGEGSPQAISGVNPTTVNPTTVDP